MLTTLRSQLKLIMWILVFAFLGTIVFSWGMGGFQDKSQAGLMGIAGGEEITYEQFNQALQRAQDIKRREGNGEVDSETLKQLLEDVWNNVIEGMLKSRDAQRLNIDVADREIAYIVENYPPNEVREVETFQREGKFDIELYKSYLRQPAAQPFLLSLENSVKNYLYEQKVVFHVAQAADISEEDIKDRYIGETARGKLAFIAVLFNNVVLKDDAITEADKRRYYKLFPRKFIQYPQAKFAYVKFKLEPSAQDSADVKAEVEDLLREIRDGADIGELAKQVSDDNATASKGGDLGWFKRGAMVKPFEEAAFEASPGDLIGPVESKFGYHIILVEDRRGSGDEEEVKARHILKKITPSADTRDEVYNVAFNFAQDVNERDFKTTADDYSFEIDTTDFFSEAGYIRGLGRMRMAAEFCFANPVGTLSEVYPVPEGYVVFKIVEKIDESTKPYNEVQSSITKSLEKIYKKNLAWDAAGEMRSRIDSSEDLQPVAEAAGYAYYVTDDSIKASGSMPSGISRDSDFMTKTFRLGAGEISGVLEGKNGYYIAHMIYKTEFNEAEFLAGHPLLYQDMASKQQDAATRNWIRELRIAADIQDFRYNYYRDF